MKFMILLIAILSSVFLTMQKKILTGEKEWEEVSLSTEFPGTKKPILKGKLEDNTISTNIKDGFGFKISKVSSGCKNGESKGLGFCKNDNEFLIPFRQMSDDATRVTSDPKYIRFSYKVSDEEIKKIYVRVPYSAWYTPFSNDKIKDIVKEVNEQRQNLLENVNSSKNKFFTKLGNVLNARLDLNSESADVTSLSDKISVKNKQLDEANLSATNCGNELSNLLPSITSKKQNLEIERKKLEDLNEKTTMLNQRKIDLNKEFESKNNLEQIFEDFEKLVPNHHKDLKTIFQTFKNDSGDKNYEAFANMIRII